MRLHCSQNRHWFPPTLDCVGAESKICDVTACALFCLTLALFTFSHFPSYLMSQHQDRPTRAVASLECSLILHSQSSTCVWSFLFCTGVQLVGSVVFRVCSKVIQFWMYRFFLKFFPHLGGFLILRRVNMFLREPLPSAYLAMFTTDWLFKQLVIKCLSHA